MRDVTLKLGLSLPPACPKRSQVQLKQHLHLIIGLMLRRLCGFLLEQTRRRRPLTAKGRPTALTRTGGYLTPLDLSLAHCGLQCSRYVGDSTEELVKSSIIQIL